MGIATVSPARLHDVAQTGQAVELIDVRTPAEFEEAHVSFARNVPLDRLEEGVLAFQGRGASQPLVALEVAAERRVGPHIVEPAKRLSRAGQRPRRANDRRPDAHGRCFQAPRSTKTVLI